MAIDLFVEIPEESVVASDGNELRRAGKRMLVPAKEMAAQDAELLAENNRLRRKLEQRASNGRRRSPNQPASFRVTPLEVTPEVLNPPHG